MIVVEVVTNVTIAEC